MNNMAAFYFQFGNGENHTEKKTPQRKSNHRQKYKCRERKDRKEIETKKRKKGSRRSEKRKKGSRP